MSFGKNIEVELDEYILQQMIESCFGISSTIGVSNSRGNWIELTYHTLRWCTVTGQTKEKRIKLIQAKEILIPRIFETEKFYYNDYFYYKKDNKWFKSKVI